MNAPYILHQNQCHQKPLKPRRSISERERHYVVLKAGINSNPNLTAEQYDAAMLDARRIAGV